MAAEAIEIRFMWEYGVTVPLWDDEGLMDEDEVPISAVLRADLEAWSDRLDRSIPPEVHDDRFDHRPVVRSLVGAGRAARRLVRPARRRAREAERLEIERLGAELAKRVQHELGPGHRVTYVPW